MAGRRSQLAGMLSSGDTPNLEVAVLADLDVVARNAAAFGVDPELLAHSAQEANGGVCSMLINNVIIARDRHISRGVRVAGNALSETYDPTTDSFTPHGGHERVQKRQLRSSAKPKFKYEPREDVHIQFISKKVEIDSGLNVSFGFVDDTLGVVTDEMSFFPILQLMPKNKVKRPGQIGEMECSVAIPLINPGDYLDKMAAESADDRRPFVWVADDSGVGGEWLATEQVLTPLYELLSGGAAEQETATTKRKWHGKRNSRP